jgi:hypothetical protein
MAQKTQVKGHTRKGRVISGHKRRRDKSSGESTSIIPALIGTGLLGLYGLGIYNTVKARRQEAELRKAQLEDMREGVGSISKNVEKNLENSGLQKKVQKLGEDLTDQTSDMLTLLRKGKDLRKKRSSVYDPKQYERSNKINNYLLDRLGTKKPYYATGMFRREMAPIVKKIKASSLSPLEKQKAITKASKGVARKLGVLLENKQMRKLFVGFSASAFLVDF